MLIMEECEKCGYKSLKNKKYFKKTLCSFCSYFAPENEEDFLVYVNEKVDSKEIQTYRKQEKLGGIRQKKGMQKKAQNGFVMSRAPFGYKLVNSKLVPDENKKIVEDIYEEFLNSNLSLNRISKKYGFSVNGLKKILTNFTYLGKVKFDGNVNEGTHEAIISSTLFNQVQDKLEKILRK